MTADEKRLHYNAVSAAWARANRKKASAASAKWRAKVGYKHIPTPEQKARYSETRRRYKKNNRAKVQAQQRIWREANLDKVNAHARKKRKESTRIRDWERARYASDLNFRLRKQIRNRVWQALKKNYKAAATAKLLGCSMESLRMYLESKFEPGMSWGNYGRGEGHWHVDHIMPCAVFDLTREDHQKACFHFSNLQPLWEADNLRKWKTLPPEGVEVPK